MVNSFAGHSSDVITRGPGAMDGEPTALERVLKRDRHIVIGGLVFVSLVSWLYILTGAGMGEIAWATDGAAPGLRRSDERRVGTGWVGKRRSGWCACLSNTKSIN